MSTMSIDELTKELSYIVMKDWTKKDVDLLIAIGSNPIEDVTKNMNREQLLKTANVLTITNTGLCKVLDSMKREILRMTELLKIRVNDETDRECKLNEALKGLGINISSIKP